jgi:serine/threonine protein kinase
MKYNINISYKEQFEVFLLNLKDTFSLHSNSIHKARNELKVLSHENISVVVKSFKVPNLFNRIIYTFFRDSKAKKSYDYSIKIRPFTPEPIGYIEFYESFLLKESYFISEEFQYNFTIREPLLDANFQNRDEIFKAFARFSFELHEAGILHQDYSPGNILIQKDNDKFIFKIVDINRMEFLDLTLKQRLQNFNKLWANNDDIEIIAKEYAKISQEDENYCITTAQYFNTKHKNKINMKKRIKGIEVVD